MKKSIFSCVPYAIFFSTIALIAVTSKAISDGTPTEVKDLNGKVYTCYAINCFGKYSVSKRCEEYKKTAIERCARQSGELCDSARKLIEGSACACAQICYKATCKKWNTNESYDQSCANAEYF